MPDGSAAATLDRATRTQLDPQLTLSTCIFRSRIPLIKITKDTVGNVFDLCKAAVQTHHKEARFIAIEYLDRPVGIDLGCKWHFDRNHKYCVYMIVWTLQTRKLVHVCPKMLLQGSLCTCCKPEYSNGWVNCLLPFEQVSPTPSYPDLNNVVTRPGRDRRVMHGMGRHARCEGNLVRFQEREEGWIECVCGRTHVDVTPGDLYTFNRIPRPVVHSKAPAKPTDHQPALGMAPAKKQVDDLQAARSPKAIDHQQSTSSANQAGDHQQSLASRTRGGSIFTSHHQAELVEGVRNAIEALRKRQNELDTFDLGAATVAGKHQHFTGASSLEIEEEDDPHHQETVAATGTEQETIASTGNGQETVVAFEMDDADSVSNLNVSQVDGLGDIGSLLGFGLDQNSSDLKERLKDIMKEISQSSVAGAYGHFEDPEQVIASIRMRAFLEATSQSEHLIPAFLTVLLFQTDRRFRQQLQTTSPMSAMVSKWDRLQHYPTASSARADWIRDHGFPWGFGFSELEVRFNTRATGYSVTRQRRSGSLEEPIPPQIMASFDEVRAYLLANTTDDDIITIEIPSSDLDLSLHLVNERQAGRDRYQQARDASYVVWQLRSSNDSGYKTYRATPFQHICTVLVDESSPEREDVMLSKLIEMWKNQITDDLREDSYRQNFQDDYWRIEYLMAHNYHGFGFHLHDLLTELVLGRSPPSLPENEESDNDGPSSSDEESDDNGPPSSKRSRKIQTSSSSSKESSKVQTSSSSSSPKRTRKGQQPPSKRRRTGQTSSSSSSSSAGPRGSPRNGSTSASSSEASHNQGWNSIVQRLREDSPRMRYDHLEDSMYRERLASEWMAARTVELIRFDQSLQSEERRKEVIRLIRQAQIKGIHEGYARYCKVMEELQVDPAFAGSSSSRSAPSPVGEDEVKTIAREVAVDAMRTATANALQEQGLLNETTRRMFTQSFQQEMRLIVSMSPFNDGLDDFALQLELESRNEDKERARVVHRLDLCKAVLRLMELLGWVTESDYVGI